MKLNGGECAKGYLSNQLMAIQLICLLFLIPVSPLYIQPETIACPFYYHLRVSPPREVMRVIRKSKTSAVLDHSHDLLLGEVTPGFPIY